MDIDKIKHLQAQVFANSLLTVGAGKSSAVLDSFVSWLLGGFGAALALILSNLDSIVPFVPIEAIKRSAAIFMVAVVVGVVEKYLAAVVTGGAESSAAGREIGEKAADLELDLSVVFQLSERAALPPMRWFLRSFLRKAAEGDLTVSGRLFTRLSNIQTFVVLAETFLILWAAVVLIRNVAA